MLIIEDNEGFEIEKKIFAVKLYRACSVIHIKVCCTELLMILCERIN